MHKSAELKDLYIRLCQAQTEGDYSFFEKHFSKQDGVIAIGTDPLEWWTGYDTITKVFKTQLTEISGIEVIADTPLAYSDGAVGWVAGRPTVKLADGNEFPVRLTAVFHKEADGWEIVQWHFSMGVPNEDAIGETLTT